MPKLNRHQKDLITVISKKVILCCVGLLTLVNSFSQAGVVSFISTDTALETAFNRAKLMALSYVGKPADPVGDWYESALPPRSAFCMRDVAHQSIAGEIFGLGSANKNMFNLFAGNISESKDWCSYWEINKYGKPAPEDYRNDTAFWYNLNANFDILNASWKLFLWTGDTSYIQSPVFKNFFDRSVDEYIQRWRLEPGSLLSRPTYPNAGTYFNEADDFNRCRGLPSYSEGVPGIKMGIDLVAAIYRGMMSYAEILKWLGKEKEAAVYIKKANQYQQHIDAYWWDTAANRYNTYYSKNNEFGKNEGETFLLWFDALKNTARKQITIKRLLKENWNVENLSYFPLIMYQQGYADNGYRYVLHLTGPATKRREYPEVSFGVIRGIVEGTMGLEADARYNRLRTLYNHSASTESMIKDVPVMGTSITVTHKGSNCSVLKNNGSKRIIWQAAFYGDFKQLYFNKQLIKAKQQLLPIGRKVTYLSVTLKPGESATVCVKING